MNPQEELKALNDQLDTKIYFMGVALDNNRGNEAEYEDMKIQRGRNNDLLETICNDKDEIEEHLSDIKTAIAETKELLNIPDYA